MIEGVDRHQWGRFDGKGTADRRVKRDRRSGTTGGGRRRDDRQPPAEGLGKFVLSALLLLAIVVGAVAGTLMMRTAKPDPHYVRATRIIANYERGKSVDRRNYRHLAYQASLNELANVDPESVSAKDAARLEREIRDNIAAFKTQLRREEQKSQESRVARQAKFAIEYERRVKARANPPARYPECESEEGADDGHDHKR